MTCARNRRLRLAVAILALLGTLARAEVHFGGELEAGLVAYPAFPYGEERFDSPLNPDNSQELRDITPITDVLTKLSGESENSDFALWIAVKPYHLAQVLLAAAAGDELQTTAVAEGLPLLGAEINTLEIYRANVGWYATDRFMMRIGRQSVLTGYGYAWNPIDFVNPLKDPYDPDEELLGVDVVKSSLALGNTLTLQTLAAYRSENMSEGLDFGDLQPGVELTLALAGLEAKLTGFYDYDDNEGDDSYVPGLGFGIKADLAGAGLYFEGALLKGSRNLFALESPLKLERKVDWLATGLAGVEYTFESGIHVLAEYLYNGEGYDRQERSRYFDHLQATSPPATASLLMYRPGFFARHYVYFNATLPVYDWNLEFQLGTLYSPDSEMMSFLPLIIFDASGALSVELSYIGLLSLNDENINEAVLSPVKHVARLVAVYAF
jgi:hypothetical protein